MSVLHLSVQFLISQLDLHKITGDRLFVWASKMGCLSHGGFKLTGQTFHFIKKWIACADSCFFFLFFFNTPVVMSLAAHVHSTRNKFQILTSWEISFLLVQSVKQHLLCICSASVVFKISRSCGCESYLCSLNVWFSNGLVEHMLFMYSSAMLYI